MAGQQEPAPAPAHPRPQGFGKGTGSEAGRDEGPASAHPRPQHLYPLRLQKYLARAGIASRRGAEGLMSSGRVTVNGQVATELGTKVDPLCDRVAVDGRPVAYPHAAVTLMLNKPTGYLTTMSDPYGRPCVAGLVPLDEYPGLFPVGRLDADTTGLLLFSTDGELGHRLTHPRHHVWKTYEALVEGVPGKEALSLIRGGMLLDDGPTLEARAEVLEQQAGAALLQIGIREGRKRQVRRMCEAVGHPVLSLCRISLGPVALGDLPLGSWRLLTDEERESLG